MRIISTLLFLVFFIAGYSQKGNPTEIRGTTSIATSCSIGKHNKPYIFEVDTLALKGKINGLNIKSPEKTTSTRITLRCGRRLSTDTPLLLIDGEIVNFSKIKDLNPNDFDNVSILKSPESMAIWGSQGINGVIIITTKCIKIVVKDQTDGLPLRYASVTIKGTKTGTATNDNGIALIQRTPAFSTTELEISCVGYKTKQQSLKPGSHIIYLEKRTDFLPEAIVACGGTRRITCSFYCISKVRGIKMDEEIMPEIPLVFKVFPSPVQTGKTITVEVQSKESVQGQLKLVGLDGKTLFQIPCQLIKGTNQVQVRTDPRWPSGIYFMQFSDELHHRVEQQKILIQ